MDEENVFYAAKDFKLAVSSSWVHGVFAGIVIGFMLGAGVVICYISTSVSPIPYP